MFRLVTKSFTQQSLSPNFLRYVRQNHYEVLNLKQNCSEKDIRESFVKLSKQFHPDTSKNVDSEQFTNIIEAYKVLSRADLRATYDLNLSMSTREKLYSTAGHQFYQQGRPKVHVRPDEYYGIKGFRKVSNLRIVVVLLLFAGIGFILQMFAIVNSMSFNREVLDEKSVAAALHHASVRANAVKYGNEKQLKILKLKLSKDE